jgi:DNA repair exonuclease SbcCD ATPase subunit
MYSHAWTVPIGNTAKRLLTISRLQDEEYEVQLRTLQQQYEQLRARYEERQARLETAAKMKRRWGRVGDACNCVHATHIV